MTIGDQDPNAYGQPSGYPPPPPPGYAPAPGYQVPGYPPQPSAGYPPPPTPGYPPVAGYQPGYPQIGYGYASHPGGLMERWGARIIAGLLVGVLSWLLAFLVGSSSSILVTGLFTGVTAVVLVILGALTFFPVLALGPIAEALTLAS